MEQFISTTDGIINLRHVERIYSNGVVVLANDQGRTRTDAEEIEAVTDNIGIIPANGVMAVAILHGEAVIVPVAAWKIDRLIGAEPILPNVVACEVSGMTPIGIMVGDKVLYAGMTYASVSDFLGDNNQKQDAA